MRRIWIFIFFQVWCGVLLAKDFLGAELYSNATVKYGRFEIRMMAASGSGTLSTFFLYYNDSWQGLPDYWREIDIEVLGKDNHAFQSNIITGHAAEKVTSEEHHTFTEDLTTRFHTYSVEWTPDYIAWKLDGVEVRRSTGQQVIDCRDQEQSYRFNTWISSVPEWVGPFDPASLPLYQYVNWIKYYAYTPGSGEGGSDFTHSWTDDFDQFDGGRWSMADWTFDENLVDFSPDNIVLKDGILILCLTTQNAPGHSGMVPADQTTPIQTNHKGTWEPNSPESPRWIIPGFQAMKDESDPSKFYTLDGKRVGNTKVRNNRPATRLFLTVPSK